MLTSDVCARFAKLSYELKDIHILWRVMGSKWSWSKNQLIKYLRFLEYPQNHEIYHWSLFDSHTSTLKKFHNWSSGSFDLLKWCLKVKKLRKWGWQKRSWLVLFHAVTHTPLIYNNHLHSYKLNWKETVNSVHYEINFY